MNQMNIKKRSRLLLVDDEAINRDYFGHRLEIEGFIVETSDSGPDALTAISQTEYDAILLDVSMPEMSGQEVLRRIRKGYSALELPVLLVTSNSESDEMIEAFNFGANDYITKPINIPVAVARINSHIVSKRLSQQLRESEARYALSARGANDGLWDWDLIEDSILFSPRWKSMLGYSVDSIGSSPAEWFDIIHQDDIKHVRMELQKHIDGETEQFECEHRMLHNDGSYRWVLTRGIAVRNQEGVSTRMAGSQTDITRGKAADPLTGLPNRVLFMDHLASAVKKSSGDEDYVFAVLFMDLDRFKIINDSLGHHTGDELLVTVAKRIESSIRESDVFTHFDDRCTVARFGGDEFVVLLKGIKNVENVSKVAQRIIDVVSHPITLKGNQIIPSISIGIAMGQHGEHASEELIRDADTAMYQAKAEGKSCYRVFDNEMRQKALERLTIENDLKGGIERNEFRVRYQPIVSLKTGVIDGFEALIRWQHAIQGLISPDEFIKAAEDTGFIVPLGAWVLEQACCQLYSWHQKYPSQSNLFVSVNVSSQQFVDVGFVDTVQECLLKSGIPPECLKLEITETAIMAHPDLAIKTFEKIRDLGVQISLDDFGTGYSSLSYLQHFPVNTLKIDRSFIERLEVSESREIIKTIVKLAHSLGMNVTAEGIESPTHHKTLSEIQCETGQGFLYSHPETPDQVDVLLSDNEKSYHLGKLPHFEKLLDQVTKFESVTG